MSTTPTKTPMTPDEMITMLNHLFGPMIIGVFLQTFIVGVLFVQASHYFARIVIILVGLALCAKSVLDIENVYRDHIFSNGHPPSSTHVPLLLARPILAEVPHFAAQCFLTVQIWVTSEGMIIPTLVGAVGSLLSLALFVVFAVHRISDPKSVASVTTATKWIPPWVFSSAVVDVYLSLMLAYFVLQTKKLNHSYRLDMNLVGQVASIAVTTCLPGAIMTVLTAILEINDTKIAVWMFFAVPLASVYSMCVLHALNSRDDLTEGSVAHAWSGQENTNGVHGHDGIGSDPSMNPCKSKTHPVGGIFTRSKDSRTHPSVSFAAAGVGGGDTTGGDLELAELEKGDHDALEHDQGQGGFIPKAMKKHRKGMRSGIEFEVQVTRTIERFDSFDDSTAKRIEHQCEGGK